MPTYDYTCPTCERMEQHQHKMTEPFFVSCLKCYEQGNPYVMTKGFGGGTAVHFKGSGFYETDYKGK